MKKILLVDAFGMIFKSYYAFINRPLRNKNGGNTSAVFGFYKSLLSIIQKVKPDYILVALEGKGECFRNAIYPEYKSNRDEPPEDLRTQIPVILELLDQLEIPHLEIESYEADDIIGSASVFFGSDRDNTIYILSSDKDLKQLVTDNVKVIKTVKLSDDIVIQGIDEVVEEFGVKPAHITDYLALTGDASDNIPGVKGIGPKTAVALLAGDKTIDDLYNNIEKVESQKIRDKLIESKSYAFLSKKLADIQKDLNLNLSINDLAMRPFKLETAKITLEENNLDLIVKDILTYNAKYENKSEHENSKPVEVTQNKISSEILPLTNHEMEPIIHRVIKSSDDMDSALKIIRSNGVFSFDIETTGLDIVNDIIICISFCSGEECFVLPINLSEKQQADAGVILTEQLRDGFFNQLKPLFNDRDILKIAHNGKFDLKFLSKIGITSNGVVFDTMLAEYCLDGADNRNGLKDLSEKYLGITPVRYDSIVDDVKKDNLLSVDFKRLSNYSAQDAFLTFKLYKLYCEKFESNKSAKALFFNIEIPVSTILTDMELTGVRVDTEYLNSLSTHLEEELVVLTQKLVDSAGVDFNPASPKQVGEILFDRLKLPVIKKTGTGASTDIDVLTKLAPLHPIVSDLLEYRTTSKIKSTYSDKLPLMINKSTGRIHTTYLQTGTQTGRLSSKDPNLQNIPVKTQLGRKIRKAFLPSGGSILLSADYSQIELFLLAEFSKDKNLYEAFTNNEDIHTKTASLIFNKDTNDISKFERTIAKTVNFGVLYGQGAYSLSQDLNIGRTEAKDYISRYFAKYSGVKDYIESVIESVRKNGYAQTYWGRKRTIPEINDNNKMKKANGERMAVNTTIQGTAADLLKIAMIRIYNKFNEQDIKSKMILQVHDELIFDTKINEVEQVKQIVKECMESKFDFKLKLKTNIETGENWGELH